MCFFAAMGRLFPVCGAGNRHSVCIFDAILVETDKTKPYFKNKFHKNSKKLLKIFPESCIMRIRERMVTPMNETKTPIPVKNDNLPAYLFHQGTNYKAYDYLGCHIESRDGKFVTTFRTWAPNAKRIGLVSDFTNWDEGLAFEQSPIFVLFIYSLYKIKYFKK